MRWAALAAIIGGLAHDAHANVSETPPSGLDGPMWITLHFGIPEFFGIGIGHTFADERMRAHLDLGTIVFVSSVTAHVDALFVRWGGIALVGGVHAGVLFDHDLIGEYTEPDRGYNVGGRLALELGGPRGFNFIIEGGAAYQTLDSLNKGAPVMPSFALRLAWGWQ